MLAHHRRQFYASFKRNPRKRNVPDEIKSGIITLVHNKNKKEDLRSYRPISLLNTDLKIYTKILANSLTPLLQEILQSYLFAAPGKTITDATTLLRDLHDYVASRNRNAFFISLDFEKTFDSVNHEWLHATLKKMSFPNPFLKIIKSLYTNATSKILINGHLTKPIKMGKGIRRGDPLSLFSFLLVANPLVINTNPERLNYSGHQNPRKGHWEKSELRRRHNNHDNR